MEFLSTIFGADEAARQIAIPQMAARAVLIYLALIVLLRLAKKRFLGDATVFDVVLSIVIGSIGGRIITGNATILPGTAAIAVLIAMHWLFSWLAVRSSGFGMLIKGQADPIIRNGKVDRAAMRAAHMGDDDLEEDLRDEGVMHPREVKEARLERSGKLSVVKRKK
ncbi:MAG TPA: YetF domain-containing protein [Xanthobacteraceae bacterium]|nr:YetF domain-containing protein [Xanthobacteraceae bacterium]